MAYLQGHGGVHSLMRWTDYGSVQPGGFALFGTSHVDVGALLGMLEGAMSLPGYASVTHNTAGELSLRLWLPIEAPASAEEQARHCLQLWCQQQAEQVARCDLDIERRRPPSFLFVPGGDWAWAELAVALQGRLGASIEIRSGILPSQQDRFVLVALSESHDPGALEADLSLKVAECCREVGIATDSLALTVLAVSQADMVSSDQGLIHVLSGVLGPGVRAPEGNKLAELQPSWRVIAPRSVLVAWQPPGAVTLLGERGLDDKALVLGMASDRTLGSSSSSMCTLRLYTVSDREARLEGAGAIHFPNAILHPIFAMWTDAELIKAFEESEDGLRATAIVHTGVRRKAAPFEMSDPSPPLSLWLSENILASEGIGRTIRIGKLQRATERTAWQLQMGDEKHVEGPEAGWSEVLHDDARVALVSCAKTGPDSVEEPWHLRIGRLRASQGGWEIVFEGPEPLDEEHVFLVQALPKR
jgi:hypothetical protein